MTELLKQGLCNPLDVVDQVFAIYAGTRGHMDKIPNEEVPQWEEGLLEFIHEQKQDLWNKIKESGDVELDKATGRSDEFEAVIAEYQELYARKNQTATV